MHDSSSVATATTHSRRGLLGKTVLAGLAAAPAVGLLTSTSQAAAQQTLTAPAREAFSDILNHEIQHVARFKELLGSKARPAPTFKNLTTSSFTQYVTMSRTLENTCVGALLGALPLIKSNVVRGVAGEFALVEGRHAGFLNVFSGADVSRQQKTGTPSAFDKPLTLAEVQAIASPLIASLNGGPPASFTVGDDVSIMNFALIFEYLGVAFYSLNNPKYLGER